MVVTERKMYSLTELREFLKEQIRIREELHQQMVGTLYPRIVEDEMLALRKAVVELG